MLSNVRTVVLVIFLSFAAIVAVVVDDDGDGDDDAIPPMDSVLVAVHVLILLACNSMRHSVVVKPPYIGKCRTPSSWTVSPSYQGNRNLRRDASACNKECHRT